MVEEVQDQEQGLQQDQKQDQKQDLKQDQEQVQLCCQGLENQEVLLYFLLGAWSCLKWGAKNWAKDIHDKTLDNIGDNLYISLLLLY